MHPTHVQEGDQLLVEFICSEQSPQPTTSAELLGYQGLGHCKEQGGHSQAMPTRIGPQSV